jgi:hypothetical protein
MAVATLINLWVGFLDSLQTSKNKQKQKRLHPEGIYSRDTRDQLSIFSILKK